MATSPAPMMNSAPSMHKNIFQLGFIFVFVFMRRASSIVELFAVLQYYSIHF